MEYQNNQVKLLRYVSDGVNVGHPNQIDLKKDLTIRPAEKVTINEKGLVTKIEYYTDCVISINPTTLIRTFTYTDKLMTITNEYTFGADGYMLHKDYNISWTTEDEQERYIQSTKRKYYSINEATYEGVLRRGNVIDTLKSNIIGLMVLGGIAPDVNEASELGKVLISQLSGAIESYINNNTSDQLVDEIANVAASGLWFDQPLSVVGGASIRQVSIATINNAELN